MSKNPSSPTKEEEILQLKEELQRLKKKLRISEQDVFRLAAEKIDLQDTIKEELTQEELEFIKSELGWKYRFAPEENTEKEVELYNSIDRKITKLLNQNKDDDK